LAAYTSGEDVPEHWLFLQPEEVPEVLDPMDSAGNFTGEGDQQVKRAP
jgi:hypothetical protein